MHHEPDSHHATLNDSLEMGCNNVKPLATKAGEAVMMTVGNELTGQANNTAWSGDPNQAKNGNYLSPGPIDRSENMDLEDIEKIKGKLGEEFGKLLIVVCL